jgi:hypothetical protein
MPAPISLSDDELEIVRFAARPIAVDRRAEFLRAVAAGLEEQPSRSLASVLQAAARAQRAFLAEAVGPKSVRSTST